MLIISSNDEYIIDVGTSDILTALYSTIKVRLCSIQNKIGLAIQFFEVGKCDTENAGRTAEQFEIIKKELQRIDVDQVVYDFEQPDKKAPWEGNINPLIHDCSTLFTTADGKDLLNEIIDILRYGDVKKVDILVFEE